MRDRIVEEKVVLEREAFIASIDRDAIRDLASSYHNGDECTIFRMRHGSFNVCFFVEFDPPPHGRRRDKWVVRIPFPGRVPWVDEKIDSEVATMKYVRRETNIPVPEVIAFSYTAGSPIGLAFIITEYVEGTTLQALGFRDGMRWQDRDGLHRSSVLTRVYDQLADVCIQLRGLEFTEIGALGMPTGPDQDIAIRHRPLPIEVLLQHVEGLEPTSFFQEKKTFKTSCDYVAALVKLAMNLLRKTRDPDFGPGEEDTRKDLFAYYTFCKYVSDHWTRKDGNLGPFVLSHGDMNLHGDNLIWDENLNLRAVIDWEWSYTVPIQCYIPPAWLNGIHREPICHLSGSGMTAYRIELISFCKSIAERSALRWPGSSLHREWRKIANDSRHLVVLALLYPDTIIDVYWNFLEFKLCPIDYKSPNDIVRYWKEQRERVDKFFHAEGARRLLQKKLSEQEAFDGQYHKFLEESGGEHRFCQCERCREEQEMFENLQELPFPFLEPEPVDGIRDGRSSSTSSIL
ncbi:Aminoglycoside 3'-phosphotransferase/choline kinase domain protein [Pleurostoma richardsiae]|uniref:Aminoglycoside 3'-phosphotransferase/choline kinase domain protein n=1 Tax=Pleurostoma richardsiae TaxID=41990 RepID=A0AA38RH00_9PEZI|nr:Aminoglycoside 3'-phosphotransferase/choline kinase domain protein [Pleurostoma richardsiae]